MAEMMVRDKSRQGWMLIFSLFFTACTAVGKPIAEATMGAVSAPVTYVVITVVATLPGSPTITPTIVPTLTPSRPAPTSVAFKTPVSFERMPTIALPTQQPTLPPSPGFMVGETTAVSPTPILTTQPTTPAPSLSPPRVAAAAPRIYETTITIPTYGYEAGFLPTEPEDQIYPYPRLDFDRVGPPSPRTYQAIVLENGFVSITVLPELGGRVYRWVDKATGRNLLYENPVIKPTHWGYRGWWMAIGGIEWAFPVEEHGLNEWRPWSYSTGTTAYGVSLTVSNIEDRTGMEVGATLSLDAGHAYLVIQPWARNNTAEAHRYQFWLNAMLALNNNAISPQTQLIVPASEVLTHSSGDAGVPGGSNISWPFYGGRDLSLYANWRGWLGFFAPNVSAGFVGVYDHAIDQGIVRAYNPGWPAGTKFFGPATLSPAHWTDNGSNYLELWSGATSSFWAYATLNSGDSLGWTEFWYPVHGMGGFTYANRAAALKLIEYEKDVAVSIAVSGAVTGRAILLVDGQETAVWPLTIIPGQSFRAGWTRPEGITGALGLRLERNDGSLVAQTGFVP
jgi:hypothetical protein